MKKLFLFDFDGTLTRRDTFLDFILFDKGILFFLSLFLKHFIQIVGYKLNLYSAEKLKIQLFNAGYLGQSKVGLEHKGKLYLEERAAKLYHDPVLEKYKDAIEQGHDVFLVSASLDVWLKQFVKDFGGKLICTEVAYENGIYEGQFKTPNCNKEEKATRIKAEIDLTVYEDILAYGNSSGDKAMFKLANQYYKV